MVLVVGTQGFEILLSLGCTFGRGGQDLALLLGVLGMASKPKPGAPSGNVSVAPTV